MTIALKEWAVTVRALAEGEQLVTLRKGGISETNKHFEIAAPRFFLYPTFDHQQTGLVRESHVPEFRRALEDGVWPTPPPTIGMMEAGIGIPQPTSVRLRAWAEIAAAYEVTDAAAIEALSPYHVWTPEYAVKRLKWKPRHPLHVLLLRCYRIPRPVTLRVQPEYLGCKSWVEIDRELAFEGKPVVSDDEFATIAADLDERLANISAIA
jgi:hypothetical protein